ncbi:MAG: sulfite reductase flavoprotein subunit alpha [Pseudomonadota bacterium]
MDILYGSVTGTAEFLARNAVKVAQARGLQTTLRELDDVSMEELAEMEDVLVFIATYGEGEMPFNAEVFWDEISDYGAPDMSNVRFGVLGLGDTAYEHFCSAGKDIDARFEELGATRHVDRIDCDLEYEGPSEEWIAMAIEKMAGGANAKVPAQAAAVEQIEERPQSWSRKNPYQAVIKENRLLSREGSSKEMRHVVLELGDSGMSYQPGDSIGIIPMNAPSLVTEFLKRFSTKYEDTPPGKEEAIGKLLTDTYEIVTPPGDLLRGLAAVAGDGDLEKAVNADKETLADYLWNKDTLDLLNLNPHLDFDPFLVTQILKPMQYRAYSVASSERTHPGEVHLTVGALRWHYDGRDHGGVCSTYIADQLAPGSTAGMFMVPNKTFRIPEDPDVPMIMVGPGTGIAPFLGFLQERQADSAKGKNWLFFGDRNRESDYVYQDELERFEKDGYLHRLDLAFSRDQSNKIYVQDRMRENGAEIYAQLEEGGHFYVCGDATRMAKDVEETLREIVVTHGGMTEQQAGDYLFKMRKDRRYLKDVY